MSDQPHTTRRIAAPAATRVDGCTHGYAYLSWTWRFS
jgi:hypothetical protein